MEKSRQKKITVFCASSRKVPKDYFDAAEKVALELIKYNYAALYGGGRVGLMGHFADSMIKNGGCIKGIIPDFMKRLEWGHTGILSLEIVDDMQERKKRLIHESDAVITLPGGIGTLDEFFETVTLKQLGRYLKPILILNTNNFFNPLLEMLDKMITQKFMLAEHRQMWSVIEDPSEIHSALINATLWDESIVKIAQV